MEKIPFVLYAESEHHLKSLVPVKKKKAIKYSSAVGRTNWTIN